MHWPPCSPTGEPCPPSVLMMFSHCPGSPWTVFKYLYGERRAQDGIGHSSRDFKFRAIKEVLSALVPILVPAEASVAVDKLLMASQQNTQKQALLQCGQLFSNIPPALLNRLHGEPIYSPLTMTLMFRLRLCSCSLALLKELIPISAGTWDFSCGSRQLAKCASW